MSRKRKIKLRSLFTLLGLVGLVITVLIDRHDFTNFWKLFGSLRWDVVLVIILMQLASYFINGLYYRSILGIFSYDVGIRRLYEGALATNFVNYILPSAGVAGAGFLSQVLAPEVPRGESVLTQIMRYALSALAVLIMIPVGLLLIAIGGNSGHAIVRTTIYSASGITLLAICALILVEHETIARRTASSIGQAINHFDAKFKPQSVNHFVNDFYKGYHAMTNHKKAMLKPFYWSIVYIVLEILTFYLVFVAFGKSINLGIAVMAYVFANIASIFGGALFSTGVFELGMAGTLVALGIPFQLSFSVTVVYRVLNLLIGLPPGFYFYRKYLSSSVTS